MVKKILRKKNYYSTNFSIQFLFYGIIIGIFIGLLFGSMLFSKSKINQNNNLELKPIETGTYSAEISILAVTPRGEGIYSIGEAEIRQGKGRVLFNLNPFVEPDTQYSVETAAKVAEKLTGKDLSKMDVIFTVKNVNAQLVGGPSAGAAFALAAIAAIEKKKIKNDVTITGTIQENGNIGEIGGIIEKAKAAGESGKKLFLVPFGQKTVYYYERQLEEKDFGGIIIQRINYVPKKINLNDYTKQWNMQTIEVKNIAEAIKYTIV